MGLEIDGRGGWWMVDDGGREMEEDGRWRTVGGSCDEVGEAEVQHGILMR